MKRSEINNYLRWAVDLMDKYQFKLPRFAYWSMDEWKENKDKIETLRLPRFACANLAMTHQESHTSNRLCKHFFATPDSPLKGG